MSSIGEERARLDDIVRSFHQHHRAAFPDGTVDGTLQDLHCKTTQMIPSCLFQTVNVFGRPFQAFARFRQKHTTVCPRQRHDIPTTNVRVTICGAARKERNVELWPGYLLRSLDLQKHRVEDNSPVLGGPATSLEADVRYQLSWQCMLISTTSASHQNVIIDVRAAGRGLLWVVTAKSSKPNQQDRYRSMLSKNNLKLLRFVSGSL